MNFFCLFTNWQLSSIVIPVLAESLEINPRGNKELKVTLMDDLNDTGILVVSNGAVRAMKLVG